MCPGINFCRKRSPKYPKITCYTVYTTWEILLSAHALEQKYILYVHLSVQYIYVAICRHVYFIKLLESLQEENDRLHFTVSFKQQTDTLNKIENYISYKINIMLFCLPLAMIHFSDFQVATRKFANVLFTFLILYRCNGMGYYISPNFHSKL